MDRQRMQDELDNLELFVLPEREACLADVLAMPEGDPDWEYREQDEADARKVLGKVKSRIASLRERLTQRAPDSPSAVGSSEQSEDTASG